jgi:hypothetical protein
LGIEESLRSGATVPHPTLEANPQAFVARFTGQTFNDIARERVVTDEVRALSP